MLNTQEISQYMRDHGSHFLGVYPLDQLPQLKRRRKTLSGGVCFIVNTDVSSLPGTHWFAVYIRQPKAEVFDSYGRPPPFPFQKWLTHEGLKWTFNTRLVQGPLSTLCGAYCIFFLGKRCILPPPISMHEIVRDEFSDRFVKNDAKIRQFMFHVFRKRFR